jgi:hypothetical protein
MVTPGSAIALGRSSVRTGSMTKLYQQVSTLQPSASACQHFSKSSRYVTNSGSSHAQIHTIRGKAEMLTSEGR